MVGKRSWRGSRTAKSCSPLCLDSGSSGAELNLPSCFTGLFSPCLAFSFLSDLPFLFFSHQKPFSLTCGKMGTEEVTSIWKKFLGPLRELDMCPWTLGSTKESCLCKCKKWRDELASCSNSGSKGGAGLHWARRPAAPEAVEQKQKQKNTHLQSARHFLCP